MQLPALEILQISIDAAINYAINDSSINSDVKEASIKYNDSVLRSFIHCKKTLNAGLIGYHYRQKMQDYLWFCLQIYFRGGSIFHYQQVTGGTHHYIWSITCNNQLVKTPITPLYNSKSAAQLTGTGGNNTAGAKKPFVWNFVPVDLSSNQQHIDNDDSNLSDCSVASSSNVFPPLTSSPSIQVKRLQELKTTTIPLLDGLVLPDAPTALTLQQQIIRRPSESITGQLIHIDDSDISAGSLSGSVFSSTSSTSINFQMLWEIETTTYPLPEGYILPNTPSVLTPVQQIIQHHNTANYYSLLDGLEE